MNWLATLWYYGPLVLLFGVMGLVSVGVIFWAFNQIKMDGRP